MQVSIECLVYLQIPIEAFRECYDCKSVFTTWRRKHHCRICGKQIEKWSSTTGDNTIIHRPNILCSMCIQYNQRIPIWAG